jgi:hypothetical protein
MVFSSRKGFLENSELVSGGCCGSLKQKSHPRGGFSFGFVAQALLPVVLTLQLMIVDTGALACESFGFNF